MKDAELAHLSEVIDLLELVRSVVPLNRTLNGPCPKCGGNDRFYITRDKKHFGCRKCSFKGDAVDFTSGVFNLSIGEAISFLTNGRNRGFGPSVKGGEQKREVSRTALTWKSSLWQEEAAGIVKESTMRLSIPGNEVALDYLHCRGINDDTIARYSVGYVPKLYDPRDKTERPAISIPWIISSGDITGIKYRYIDELASANKSRRYRQHGGGDLIVFGIQAFQQSKSVVIIEGEINAMSISQACLGRADVMSIGGDSNPAGMLQAVKISMKYDQRLVWMDDPDKVKQLSDLYNRNGEAVTMAAQPMGRLGSELSDANDVLHRKGGDVLRTLIMGKLQEVNE